LLSLGIDRTWRRRAARSLELSPGARVLDIATGTGALANDLPNGTQKSCAGDIPQNIEGLGDLAGRMAAPRHRALQTRKTFR
jgi:demethylmenaquinone methyltransferase/2-methoxy-6-polyprenyl-1,4-benzoquinol methylase